MVRAKRKRRRPVRRWIARCVVACALLVVVLASGGVGDPPHQRDRPRDHAVAARVVPAGVAKPAHLTTTYVAPPAPARAAIGWLRIERLGIRTPVVPVGWDGDAMAVPNDVRTVGWFTPTAGLDDLAGSTVVAGHVSDQAGSPGAFAPLVAARVGDLVVWRAGHGKPRRFRVLSIRRYPRSAGLPRSLFQTDGAHTIRLVTCAHRVRSATGFHYTDNLVVSALAL